MEPIDAAHARFQVLIAEVRDYSATLWSEQDTRLKVINRILTEALGWPYKEIRTEEQAGHGFIDYKLTVDGLARLVVEAKRDDRSLGTEARTAGRAYKLNGSVFNTSSVKEGIEQAIKYCGQKNAELACVTNGREWIIFRGSRLGDGRDTLDGSAFVFPALEAIATHFAAFYDLLSYESASQVRFRAHFQEAEGRPIRTQVFRKALRGPESKRPLRHDKLSSDLDRVMTSFFRRLNGDDDPELLAQCFVVTRESEIADEKLARISEDLLGRIRDLNTASGEQLTELVARVKATQRNEFVILVGTKGAGKSTFVERFFLHVLPRKLLADCIVARVNLADSKGNEATLATWLDQYLLETLERALFRNEPPNFEELQGMFFDEYQRWSMGSMRYLYQRDKEQFKIEFGKHIEKRREERPHEYIKRLVHHVVRGRGKIPCIVFDNADHFTIEFQERVFQYARSIYESEICVVIMPITDRTSWQLSREGALRSFESESLYLPTPAPEMVLRKRIGYLEARLAEEKRQPGRGYFVGRGISVSIENLTAFTATLQAMFLRSGEPAYWIGNLANRDIRRCLEIAKHVVTSPHIGVDDLITSYVADTNIDVPLYRIKRALIKGQYDIHPGGVNSFVHNIYAIDDHTETTPLLGLRILHLLRDAQKSDPTNPFVTVEQVIKYCEAMLIEASSTVEWLGRMLETGLCLSYDPTITTVTSAGSVEISPAGYQHLSWGIGDWDYGGAMVEVTPYMDSATFDVLRGLNMQRTRDTWRAELRTFVHYLVSEDTKYCKVPEHDAYVQQKRLALLLERRLVPPSV